VLVALGSGTGFVSALSETPTIKLLVIDVLLVRLIVFDILAVPSRWESLGNTSHLSVLPAVAPMPDGVSKELLLRPLLDSA
jgi:hypothetical protein